MDALLVFADVVDSSKYSAVLTYEEYAERLLRFQRIFTGLGRRYFPEVEDKALAYSRVEARGDEGIVFVAEPRSQRAALVLRAIEFLYHLKGLMRFAAEDSPEQAQAPQRLSIGAGVHFGPVAYVVGREDGHSVVDGLEGFEINYAKRVESCSRECRYSRILLSAEAARCLELEPVVLLELRSQMRGIAADAALFEVQSGLFDHLELCAGDPEDCELTRKVSEMSGNPETIDEPWLKAFVIGLLESLSRATPVQQQKDEYRKQQIQLAWHSANEDDPILLYLRSKHYRDAGQRTQEIRYLRQLIERHPCFVHARLMMIRACWAVARGPAERAEKLYARDMAREFLEHFPQFLTGPEKAELTSLVTAAEEAAEAHASAAEPTSGTPHQS
jgi:class 3 adenylate cyclase